MLRLSSAHLLAGLRGSHVQRVLALRRSRANRRNAMRCMRARRLSYARGCRNSWRNRRRLGPIGAGHHRLALLLRSYRGAIVLASGSVCLRPNYSFNATVMCRADNSASLSGALTQALGYARDVVAMEQEKSEGDREVPTQAGGAVTFAVAVAIYSIYIYAGISNHIAAYIVATLIGRLAVPALGALFGAAIVWAHPRYRWAGATIGFIVVVALMYVGQHHTFAA